MKKSGFTLIELVIGMLFSGILITVLFSSFSLINRVNNFVDRIISRDVRVAIIDNQLQKDLNGAFIPLQAVPAAEKKSTPLPGQKDAAAPKEPAKKEEKKKLLENVFIGRNKDNNLSVLSFITNNPLLIYEKEKGIVAKPRIVRVVYRLAADKEHPGSFILTRQEGSDLSLDAYDEKAAKQIKGYHLGSFIKSIKAEYNAPKKQENKDQKKEYSALQEWPEKEKKSDEKPEMPQFIKIEMVLWDEAMEEEKKYSFMHEIFAREQL
ncbi:type II secretion system protein [Candidatus Dependentiae bacterium]|nr:type II secretion system protein [Candidatus Dependentiae bacterium]